MLRGLNRSLGRKPAGILVPNLVSYSYALGSWLSLQNVTAATDTTGPTGDASTVTESSDGGATLHRDVHGWTCEPSTWYEAVLLAKPCASGRGWAQLTVENTAESKLAYQWINLSDGALGTSAAITWSVDDERSEDWADGWYAARFSFLTDAGDSACYVIVTLGTANLTWSYQGDGRDAIEVAHVGIYKGKSSHNLAVTNG